MAKLASPSTHQFNSDPKSQPHPPTPAQGSSWECTSSNPRSYARVRGTQTGRGTWACGLGLAGRRPGSEQSSQAPPTWGEGGGRRLEAPRAVPARRRPRPGDPSPGWGAAVGPLPVGEQRPFGTMGPLPRLRAGRYKGRGARPGKEPGVGK